MERSKAHGALALRPKADFSTNAHFMPQEESTKPFHDCTTTFAIDISGSTRGPVLSAERRVISTISSHLSAPAHGRVRLIPWNSTVHPALLLPSISNLSSGGGTTPSNLCTSSYSTSLLRQSSLWFLLTDGLISADEVHKFANGVATAQLHGTPCINIIFGHRPSRPMDINVSVGFSLFAVVPHCLLLFHDIDSDTMYVIRARGCFEPLNELSESDFDTSNINWTTIARMSYLKLANLPIPPPLALGPAQIALSNDRVVDMDNLLSDRYPRRNSREIISTIKTARRTGPSDLVNASIEHGLTQTNNSDEMNYGTADTLPRPSNSGINIVPFAMARKRAKGAQTIEATVVEEKEEGE
ncbi:hypothetical protein G7Y79_00047g083190 [Physcia stellaris]|nr:hypothetical protein G7Y79_00047g083190 [Physcia stellaris]